MGLYIPTKDLQLYCPPVFLKLQTHHLPQPSSSCLPCLCKWHHQPLSTPVIKPAPGCASCLPHFASPALYMLVSHPWPLSQVSESLLPQLLEQLLTGLWPWVLPSLATASTTNYRIIFTASLIFFISLALTAFKFVTPVTDL